MAQKRPSHVLGFSLINLMHLDWVIGGQALDIKASMSFLGSYSQFDFFDRKSTAFV